MLLVLDVGNTAVSHAVYDGKKLRDSGHILHRDLAAKIPVWLRAAGRSRLDIAVSSVVPDVTKALRRALKKNGGVRLWVAGENLPVPISHIYKNSRKLGIDRQVNIYGALRMHNPPMLVIDFGTAVTFDYVSRKGIFLGGLIVPGPELSFQALVNRAALIPNRIRLPKKAPGFPGTSTKACMEAGILEGYGAMTDGLVARFRKKYGAFEVLATGGFAAHLNPYSINLRLVDPLLTLKSVVLLYENAGLDSD